MYHSYYLLISLFIDGVRYSTCHTSVDFTYDASLLLKMHHVIQHNNLNDKTLVLFLYDLFTLNFRIFMIHFYSLFHSTKFVFTRTFKHNDINHHMGGFMVLFLFFN